MPIVARYHSAWLNVHRATTRVKKPICIFPTEKVALGELLAAGHLAEADTEGQRGFIKLYL